MNQEVKIPTARLCFENSSPYAHTLPIYTLISCQPYLPEAREDASAQAVPNGKKSLLRHLSCIRFSERLCFLFALRLTDSVAAAAKSKSLQPQERTNTHTSTPARAFLHTHTHTGRPKGRKKDQREIK